MTRYAAGDTVVIEVHLYDQAGAAITNAASGDFGVTCYRREKETGSATVVTPSAFAHVAGPIYTATIEDAEVGVYSAAITCSKQPCVPHAWSAQVETAAQADPAGALGANHVTLLGPATAAGDFRITQGDVYSIALGNHLPWSLGSTPSLSGQTVTFTPIGSGLVIPCTVVGAGTSTQIVKAELTSNQSAAIPTTTRRYELRAVEADVKLASGSLIVAPADS